jgi:hypothetical protein
MFRREPKNDDSDKGKKDLLFKERGRSQPYQIYVGSGRIPIRYPYAEYTLVCTRCRYLETPKNEAVVPHLGLAINKQCKPIIEDATDAETWSRLLGKPPTHLIELRYVGLSSGINRYLLSRRLNFTMPYYSQEAAVDWTAHKVCKRLEKLLLDPPPMFNHNAFFIHSMETITMGFWMAAVQRKFRELWIEDNKQYYLTRSFEK